MNAAIPVWQGDNPAARPFVLQARSMADRFRSLDCLTSAIYYEAASESDDGQRAVAQVVLNRVRHPSYPNSVCGVVYQGSERATGCQFTFTCDGSLARIPSAAGWARARRIAAEALAGSVFAPVGLSTHYHSFKVLPAWASTLVKSAVIGAHIFYRWQGQWGAPTAFSQHYAGAEPMPAPYRPAQQDETAIRLAQLRAETTALLDLPHRSQPRDVGMNALPNALASSAVVPEVMGGPRLPESRVRPEYLNSGVPKDEMGTSAR